MQGRRRFHSVGTPRTIASEPAARLHRMPPLASTPKPPAAMRCSQSPNASPARTCAHLAVGTSLTLRISLWAGVRKLSNDLAFPDNGGRPVTAPGVCHRLPAHRYPPPARPPPARPRPPT